MVAKKKSRALSRAKPRKPDADCDEKENAEIEEEKEQLLKRLADFEKQVEEAKKLMESEKEEIILAVENLYFIDEQKNSSDMNNMSWADFLKLNTCPPKSAVRQSIAELLIKTEQRPKRKKAGASTVKKTVTKASATECTPSTRSSKRGRQPYADVACTPQNQNIPVMSSNLLITPKFDPRVPIPPNTIRKAKLGEIAVSLQGSPLQIGRSKNSGIENLKEEDVDAATKEELKILYDKMSKLLDL